MADANGLVEAMKRAAVDAEEARKPADAYFGVVSAASPLRINVEQKMELGEEQLILTRNVTDFRTRVTACWQPEGEETKEVTVHNGLAVGDEVILLRQRGGQKFIVWDRVGR